MTAPYDFLVLGSGFGGSVSALRLAEKGYRVAVLEAGKRWRPADYPRSNWDLRRFLWMPALGCHGIQRITLFKHFAGLSGAGVGGGSLVYAATLLSPPDPFFRDPAWAGLDRDWRVTLEPHFETARRMLGVVRSPRLGRGDELLREYARSIGRERHFHHTHVGIFFGEPGRTVPDPYFEGRGPARTGCDFSAACMIGCRSGSKNTLDLNYLYLAEKLGAEIHPETEAVSIRSEGGGYVVESRNPLGPRNQALRRWEAKQVVVAAGTLGTLSLLHRCREEGWLPHLSPRLGDRVRTNSEVILGARSNRPDENFCDTTAITSGVYVTDDTHIEVVRYPEGSDAMGLLAQVLTDGGALRPLRFFWTALTHPTHLARCLWPPGWARQALILLVMQTLDNHLSLSWGRRWYAPWRKTLVSRSPRKLPTFIPEANQAARAIAEKMGGVPQGSITEVFLDRPLTAHVLGGCPMGASPDDGVVDRVGRAFGHPGLYIVDGSIIPANLGVNPSLTITALAEHVMAAVPGRSRTVITG